MINHVLIKMASKRTNQSSVWEHMTKLPGNKVQCNLCTKEMAYAKSSSTSTMMYHLRSMHTSIFEEPKGKQPSLSSFGVGPQRPCSESRTEKITALVVKCIVSNMLPLSFVEKTEFRELTAFVEPSYVVPRRDTIGACLDSTKPEITKKVAEEMQSAPAVHITTDIWTNLANDAYISVTASRSLWRS